MQAWHPTTWRQFTSQQLVTYPDEQALALVIEQLKQLPPIVTPLEIKVLKQKLAAAANGDAFLLQGGDCAEQFQNCQTKTITNKLKILLQMSLILIHGLRKPVIRVGRIAGQYAKPRSSTTETQGDISLPTYRGDLINQASFSERERIPNPELMIKGYSYAAITLNYIRSLVDSGFANLEHPEYWNLDFVKHSPLADQYQRLVTSIGDALSFIKTISGLQSENINRVDFFTSHEALHLYYEEALARQDDNGKWYNSSTHYPWIGMRTADLEGGHVEFMRGINNPIAVKIGPGITESGLLQLIDRLNPDNEHGRLTLIIRLGAKNVTDLLPRLIEPVKKAKKNVLWSCDPMHGNTHKTKDGIKTRRFDDILDELQQSFRIHKELGTHLAGVHFELTGEDVTECIGGARGLTESDLSRAYESLVDPRLNYEQALEMALLIAGGDV